MRKIKDPVKLVFEFILVGILFFIFYIALSSVSYTHLTLPTKRIV